MRSPVGAGDDEGGAGDDEGGGWDDEGGGGDEGEEVNVDIDLEMQQVMITVSDWDGVVVMDIVI